MRSEIFDERVSPVENLAANPSFERVVSGGTIIRRNYKTNPTPTSATDYTAANGATMNFISIPYAALELTTPVSATADSGLSLFSRTSWLPGEVWTLSFDVEAITADTYRMTYTGGGMGNLPAGITFFAGEKKRLSYTFTVRSQASGVIYFVRSTASQSQTFRISKVLVEKRPSSLPYFDGSTNDNTDSTYSWEGTANASTSVAKAGATEIMRNYFKDPGARSNAGYYFNGWAGTNATATQTTVSVSWSRSGSANRFTRTSAATSIETAGIMLNGINLSVGSTYTLEYDIVTNRAASLTSTTYFVGSTNTGWTINSSSPTVTTTAGTPQHIWITFTVGSGGDARLCAFWSNQVTDDWSEVSNITIYAGVRQANFAYFDGDNTPDTDLTPAWTGTVNASASTLSAPTPANTWPMNSAYTISSSSWSKSGQTSLRQIPSGPISGGAEGWTALAGSSAGLSGMGITFKPNATYTALIYSRLTAPQNINTSTARMLQFVDGTIINDWGSVVAKGSTRAANVAGETLHRITFAVRSNAVWALLRVSSGGGAGNGDVWWDNLAIIEGVYTGPYIDGDIPGCIWRGTPHNSTSIGYPSSI